MHDWASNMQELLLAILKEAADMYGPLLLLLEDLQFFDILSWQLSVVVANKLEDRCLLIATVRPRDGILAVTSNLQSGKEGFQFQFQQAQTLLAVLQVSDPQLQAGQIPKEHCMWLSLSKPGFDLAGSAASLHQKWLSGID